MLPIKFSWRIFLTTVILGIGIVFPLEIAYASFISSSVNQKNSISSGYWITPTVTPLPVATMTPEPTVTIEPTATETPVPTATVEPTVTETPIPTETIKPTTTIEPTVTDTPEPTNTVEPTVTEVPVPTETIEPTMTQTPEPTATTEPTVTQTPVPTDTPEPTITETPEPTATVEPIATMTPEPTATETPIPTASPLSVVLNEFMPDPASGNEWVELYNNTGNPVPLTGWKIEDVAHHAINISGDTIDPFGYKVYFYTNATTLNNSGDTINLINDLGELKDTVTYTSGMVASDKTIGKETDGTGIWKKCTNNSEGLINDGSC